MKQMVCIKHWTSHLFRNNTPRMNDVVAAQNLHQKITFPKKKECKGSERAVETAPSAALLLVRRR